MNVGIGDKGVMFLVGYRLNLEFSRIMI